MQLHTDPQYIANREVLIPLALLATAAFVVAVRQRVGAQRMTLR